MQHKKRMKNFYLNIGFRKMNKGPGERGRNDPNIVCTYE
jgi:hypothetical protein